jgi:chitinase
MAKSKLFLLSAFFFIFYINASAQQNNFSVIAYYAGGPNQVDSFPIEKLTHIIFSFSHLKGNELHINNARDTATIEKLVSLKSRNPNLKVILSLGGWGGCATCSDVFSTKSGRKEFVKSVKNLSKYFHTDGIDLDWEYPAIEGFPSHKYQAADKQNFTSLVNQLRKKLGNKYEISFAAGGFRQFIEESIEWEKVMKKVDRVNLMTYDLVNGFDTSTGHHTPLYSTPYQTESTAQAVKELVNAGVAKNKIVIGAAFYARIWENVADSAFGLYQTGRYKKNVDFKNFDTQLSVDSGFIYHWDEVANAPYMYNPAKKLFVTYDNKNSIRLKTQYVVDQGLNGIMFWQLAYDTFDNGLLGVIDDVKTSYKSASGH